MKYVVDSNIFIESKNKFYSFDICPGFWDSLLYLHNKNVIASVSSVKEELCGHKDDLSIWIKNVLDPSFFIEEVEFFS